MFLPSVAVDAFVMGDLARGEYLAIELQPGTHVGVQQSRVVHGDAGQTIHLEAALCWLGNVVSATAGDRGPAPEAIRDLRPAW